MMLLDLNRNELKKVSGQGGKLKFFVIEFYSFEF